MDKGKAITLTKKFNGLFPVGSEVEWRSVNSETFPFQKHVVSSQAFVSAAGHPVVFIKGKAGYVSIEPEFLKYPENS